MKKTLLLFLLLPFLGFSQAASGTFVINSGSAAPLNSLSNAIAYINTNGVSGPVTLLIDNNQTISSQIAITSTTINATNTLTIKPNSGKDIIINAVTPNGYTSVPAIFLFNGVKNVTIDGSNSTSNTKNLTLYSEDGISYNSKSIFWIASNGTTPSTNITVKNCIIKFKTRNDGENLLTGVYSGNNTIGGNNTMTVEASTSANSAITISNNDFVNVKEAVNINGDSNTSKIPSDWIIQSNKIGSLTESEKPGSGINVSNSKNFTISNNTISGVSKIVNSLKTASAITISGTSSGTISSNYISDIANKIGNNNSRTGGIYITSTGIVNIYNNFISKISTPETDNLDQNYHNRPHGIYIESGTTNLYYNTIVMNYANASGYSSCLYIAGGTGFNIKNNIFYNSQLNGKQYSVFIGVAASAITSISNNDYYVANATNNFSNRLGTISYTGNADFTNWKKNTTFNPADNSVQPSILPVFQSESTSDFRLQNVAGNYNLAGVAISGITTDYYNTTRVKPYIGAFEIYNCTAPTITTQPTALIACEGQDGTFTVATSTTGVTYQWQYSASADGSTGWTNTDGTQDVSGHTTAVLKLTNIPLSYSNYYVRCIVSSSATCFTYSSIVKLTVNPKIVANVTLTSSEASTTICDGTLVTFKATSVNGGTNPKYQWYIGTTLLADQTGAQYTTNGLKNGDAIKVVMTSDATSACLTSNPATSNVITVAIIKTDRGRTKGGIHICQGSANPTLGVYNFDDPNKDQPYSGPGTIIRWEYSDDNNKTWKPIANTAGKITYTPTEILTASRNYRAVTQNGTCDEQYAIETRIDVEFAPTINSQSTATQTQCIGGSFNPLTVTATGFGTLSYQWYSNTTASTTGGTSLVAANGAGTNSYTPQSTTAGTLYYYCIVTGTCGPTTSAISEAIVTKAAPTAPKVGTITQPTCTTLTGSVVLENVPPSGRLLESRGTIYNFTASGTTFEISGLAPGTYKFAIDNNCSIVYSADIVIKSSTNIWDGTKWSKGTPSASDPIEFTGTYDLDTDVVGCSCTISNGANVTIQKERTLTITNEINVNSGTLTFENNASLVQINNVTNTGIITYKRISPPIFQKDYLYWSTPVNPQKLVDVSPLTTSTKYFGNDGKQWVVTDRESNMIIGKGYIIRGPANYSNTVKQEYSASFKGVPNNGDLEGELLKAGDYNVIGNPYPSALSADALISQNSVLNGTIYFWTHNTPAKPTPTQQYTVDDYAAYNLSGGVSAKSDPNHSISGQDNGIKPTGQIAAGQAFYVNVLKDGKVKFNNTMRVGGASNSQFFKSATSKETVLEKNRIWLNMTNDAGVFKQVLVGYIEGATNDYDIKYDGISFDANPYLDFYSVSNTNNYVIQGRALPFTNSDIVPLGYRTTVEGNFTISIDEVDGEMNNQAIYVEDKTTGTIHDLRTGNYTFNTGAGTFTDRLVLRYTNKTLGTGDFENLENGILVSVKNKVINILSSNENIKDVTVYDISGRLLYDKKVSNTELQIQNLQSSNQILLVKVTLDNDFTTTKKIIFN